MVKQNIPGLPSPDVSPLIQLSWSLRPLGFPHAQPIGRSASVTHIHVVVCPRDGLGPPLLRPLQALLQDLVLVQHQQFLRAPKLSHGFQR